jgi:hypothetical protein
MRQELNRRWVSPLMALLAFVGAALACAPWQRVPPPGEGEKAEAGFRVCQPVIEALAAYEADLGIYPDSLDALSPDYLEDIPETVNDLPINYQQEGASYTLSFSYEGPGMNRCSYTPEENWDCFGYY